MSTTTPNGAESVKPIVRQLLKLIGEALGEANDSYRRMAVNDKLYTHMRPVGKSHQMRARIEAALNKLKGRVEGVDIRTRNNGFFITYQTIVIHIKLAQHPEQLVTKPNALSDNTVERRRNGQMATLPLPGIEEYQERPLPLNEYHALVLLYIRDDAGLIAEAHINDQRGTVIVESIPVPLIQPIVQWGAVEEDSDDSGMDFGFKSENGDQDDVRGDEDAAMVSSQYER